MRASHAATELTPLPGSFSHRVGQSLVFITVDKFPPFPAFVQTISSKLFQQIRPLTFNFFARATAAHIITVHPQQRTMAKAWDLIFVGEGGSVAAVGLGAAH